MDLLPADVLADVLSRLPPRAIAVSRGVCKRWRAVADADARCQQQLRATELGGFFVRTNESYITPSFFVRPSMAHRIAGDLEHYMVMAMDRADDYPYSDHYYYHGPEITDCCNGLLLLEGHVVVNPATGKWAHVPPYDPDLPEEHEQESGEEGEEHEQETGEESSVVVYLCPFLVFDPMLSPHYQVVYIKSPPRARGKLPEGRQHWPPPVYVAYVYSSRTGRWEQRPLVRDDQGDTGTVASVELGPELWRTQAYRGANWHGALYVFWSDCIMR
ncbi:unnamed protein product [Urochloa humidicola]